MLGSDAFSYINVLDKAADASWLRESVIANNIANVDTPYYKRQDVAFETVLKREIDSKRAEYRNLDSLIKHMDTDRLEPIQYKDHDGFSYRVDYNNVDIDTENVELASEQLRYNALTSSISNEFGRFKSVMS